MGTKAHDIIQADSETGIPTTVDECAVATFQISHDAVGVHAPNRRVPARDVGSHQAHGTILIATDDELFVRLQTQFDFWI